MIVGVTGAAGYIGSRICHELRGSHTIVPIDNFHKGTIRTIGDVEVINADIRDKKAMEIFQDTDCIIHLAAVSGVEACNTDRDFSYDVNVNGTRIIAEICRDNSIPLIFASSFGVMGDPVYFPIDENHPRNPLHDYGKTKYEGEKILTEAALDHFPCYLFIKSNVYGVHIVDGTPVFKSSVINKYVNAAKTNNPLTVYNPGTQARNFLHVKDAARAYILAVPKIIKAKLCAEPFCIASSEALSIRNLAEKVRMIAEEYNYDPPIHTAENPRTETLVEDFSVNTAKAQTILGFTPHYTVEKAVREMLEENIL